MKWLHSSRTFFYKEELWKDDRKYKQKLWLEKYFGLSLQNFERWNMTTWFCLNVYQVLRTSWEARVYFYVGITSIYGQTQNLLVPTIPI